FIFVRSGSHHRTIKLSVLFDADIKATFAGKNTGLFFHTVVVAAYLVFAGTDIDVWCTTYRVTATDADFLLFGIIAVTVLLTL
ncbi:hypothetical protein, partial [Proteus faecis]|uniref:hypothetical protein n=1 Tax=Proteus faecis TaxID=2050967 RepID=UPI0036F1C8A2